MATTPVATVAPAQMERLIQMGRGVEGIMLHIRMAGLAA
jgi:hypothetical protein